MDFREEQIERYSRHIILPEVGGVGQRKLLEGRVLIVGAGGLGSPAALYLTAGGIGRIGIVDGDDIDLSNLQRQIIHFTSDIGKPKVNSAAMKMRALNPDVDVRTYHERLTSENAPAIISEYDFVIDGTDNFAAKFLIADACHFAGKPYSHAGIFRFEGQLMTVIPGQSTCYRCVFNAPPPPGTVPSCSQAGVLGVIAGVIGTLQAAEAVKFLLGKGDLLTDSLLVYDCYAGNFRKLKLSRNPDCPICGKKPVITGLTDEVPQICDPKS